MKCLSFWSAQCPSTIPVKERWIIIAGAQLWPGLTLSFNDGNKYPGFVQVLEKTPYLLLGKSVPLFVRWVTEKTSVQVVFKRQSQARVLCGLHSVCDLLCPVKAVRFWEIPSRSHNLFMHLVGFDGEGITRKYGRTRAVADWHRLFEEVVKSPSLTFLTAS